MPERKTNCQTDISCFLFRSSSDSADKQDMICLNTTGKSPLYHGFYKLKFSHFRFSAHLSGGTSFITPIFTSPLMLLVAGAESKIQRKETAGCEKTDYNHAVTKNRLSLIMIIDIRNILYGDSGLNTYNCDR